MPSSTETTVTFTADQATNIKQLGLAAQQSIQHAQSQGLAPPTGVWRPMYNYILRVMNAQHIGGAQAYWFREAGAINGNDLSNPAGFFVRDITALGFHANLSDPKLQDISDQIGNNIFTSIEENTIANGQSSLPFDQQLQADIRTAINTFGLPIGSWGGSFYFWNFAYQDSTTVGQAIESDSQQAQTFVTNNAQAMADSVNRFGVALLSNDQASTDAFKQGFVNLALGGLQSEIIGLHLVEQLASDLGQQLLQQFEQLINLRVDGIVLGFGNEDLFAANGSAALFGGQVLGNVGNDTLNGGTGDDSFVFVLPTSGSATETIDDATGRGQTVVLSGNQVDILGGSASTPLLSVQGATDVWQDSQGTTYSLDAATRQLTIADGALGANNQIVVNNFDLQAATDGKGFLGLHLANALTLTAGATAGVDPPTSAFIAGSMQSYTVAVDAASDTAQAIVVSLSGAPAADFGLVTTSGTVGALNSDGTFTVTIPSGETSASFSLLNTGDVGTDATLQLTAALQSLNGGATIASSAPLTQSFQEPALDPLTDPVPVLLTDAGDSNSAFQSYGEVTDGGSHEVSNGSNYIVVHEANESIDGGTGNDTIEADFRVGRHGDGVDVINGNGGQDIFWVGAQGSLVRPVRIYANQETDLQSAVQDANAVATGGQQGDLFAVGNNPFTLVGGLGDDFFSDEGDGVIVAGSGNDTFVGGVVIETVDNNGGPTYGALSSTTWSSSIVGGRVAL